MQGLTPDQLLTTTRSVRRRLDLERPVARSVIQECLELALQAPNGSNLNSWHWIVIDDPEIRVAAARIYNAGLDDYTRSLPSGAFGDHVGGLVPGFGRISDSVAYLRDNLHRVPALLVPLIAGRTQDATLFHEASLWGSVLPAVWSFMLALRARGLGSTWTTGHLFRENEMAKLLEIPSDRYQQVGLFPIAWTLGTDFKPAWRKPARAVSSWNRFEREGAGVDEELRR